MKAGLEKSRNHLPTLLESFFESKAKKNLEFPYSRLHNGVYFFHCERGNCRADSVEREDDITSQEASDKLVLKAVQGTCHCYVRR